MRELASKETVSPADSEWATLVELLRWRASHQSDQRAYTFLSKGEEELSLTYAGVLFPHCSQPPPFHAHHRKK